MEFETLEVSEKEQVTTVWLNRPEAKNAFNPRMIEELVALFSLLETRDNQSVVILRGKNKQFCAGADIKWMQASGEQSAEENLADSQRIAHLLETLYNCPLSVISVVEGSAMGGALGLLGVSDWVIAADDVRFAFPEVRLGIAPANIMPYILFRSPVHVALQKFLTGQTFSSYEATGLGLVDHVCMDEEIDELLQEILDNLQKGAPKAQKEIKQLSRKLQQKPNQEVILEAIQTLSRLKQSEEGQEGLKAFIEKRKPNWM